MRLKHDVKIDKFKLLQDVELPIRVKKLKRERERMIVPLIIEEIKEIGVSSQGNSEDNSISDN